VALARHPRYRDLKKVATLEQAFFFNPQTAKNLIGGRFVDGAFKLGGRLRQPFEICSI
jgi:hypothetical protein